LTKCIQLFRELILHSNPWTCYNPISVVKELTILYQESHIRNKSSWENMPAFHPHPSLSLHEKGRLRVGTSRRES
jgi:hypothetical protein